MNLLLRLANSAQRLSRFIRRRKVLLQSLAGALALGLGLWGWMLEEPPVNIQGWLNNIFRTFQMITLQFPRSFDMNISWQLQLARLLLPAVAALATLHVIVGAITRPARLALMPHAHGHIIVCGSEQLTEASLKTLAKRGEQIVVAASDMEVARRETLEGLGLTVIEADPAQPSTFSALNAKQAAAIFFTYDQDLANIDLAMQAMANISGRPASDPPLALAVLIEREDLARELDATLDRLARARRVRYHRLCPDRDGLRQELQRLAPAFRKADAAARSHLLIIGLAGVWRQTLMQLIVSAQDNADRPPLLTLALDDAEAEALDAWRAQTPDLHLVAEFAIIHRDGTLLPTEEELASHPIEAPHLVVVLRPDEDAVATALALRRPENVFGLTDQPILVRRTAEDRFLGRLSDDGREAAPRIAAFGGLIRAAAIERILDRRGDDAARALHERYLAAGAERPRDAPLGWDDLPENLRDANRAAADHAAILAAALAWEADRASPLTTAEMDRAARIEHRRWMADRIDRGWRYGPVRDDDRRIHPSIKPFDEISADERDKDRRSALNLLDIARDKKIAEATGGRGSSRQESAAT